MESFDIHEWQAKFLRASLKESRIVEEISASELKSGMIFKYPSGKEFIVDLGGREVDSSTYIYIGDVNNYKNCYVVPAGRFLGTNGKYIGTDVRLIERFIDRWDNEETAMKPFRQFNP